MKEIIKNKTVRIFSLGMALVSIVSLGVFMQGCSNDPLFDDTESNERLKTIEIISSSNEFQEYLITHFNFMEKVNNIKGAKVIGKVDGNNLYRSIIDIKLFDDVIEARNLFLSKYPEYKLLDDVEKLEAIENACIKSKVLNKYILQKENSSIVRLKSSTENNGGEEKERFNYEDYDSWEDAYDACKEFSQKDSIESGGFIYPNGTAVFVTDTQATDSTMRIPFKGANGAQGWFHYHPSENTGMSPQDSIGIDTLKARFGVTQMIILTKDSIATYNF